MGFVIGTARRALSALAFLSLVQGNLEPALAQPGSQPSFAAPVDSTETCGGFAPAADFPDVGPNYVRRYNTIAHRFLDDERGAGDVTPQMYAILDSLIDEARTRLERPRPGMSDAETVTFATRQLNTIDCILIRHGFVYPGTGLVQLLSDGLQPTIYDVPEALNDLNLESHNDRRARYIEARGQGPFYVVDCDTASFLYLAIGEIMHYPLHLVSLPVHNFVRWTYSRGQYLDYETMDGRVETDDHYKNGGFGIYDPANPYVDGNLRTLSDRQSFAYHDIAVGQAWSWRRSFEQMVIFYRRSVARDPDTSTAFNKLAWYYGAQAGPLADGRIAIRYATRAVRLYPSATILDTMACAYARNGQFDLAASEENRAINTPDLGVAYSSDIESLVKALRDDLASIEAHHFCTDDTPPHERQPFRPHVAYPSAGR